MTAQTEAREAQAGEFGKARLRKEDERLITGQTNWTDNIVLPGMLHIAFLRSPYAHARITSVDVKRGAERAGRHRRLLRRGLRRRAGQPALRLAGHPGHRDPGPPADGGGRGAVRRRGGGLRGGPRPLRRGRRPGRHRGRLRAASAGTRHQDGPGRGLAQGPRGGQQELRVGLRQRRHGGGVPRRARRARAHLSSAAADPGRDGAARGGLLERRRGVHPVVGDPDPACAAGHARPGHRHR